MLDVLRQTLWFWAILASLPLFIALLPLVIKRLFNGWWRRGCWSAAVYGLLLFTCAALYLSINAAAFYVYQTPNEGLQVIVPTPTPLPETTEGGAFAGVESFRAEEIIASMIHFPVLFFISELRPFIPLFMGGLLLISLLAIAIGFVTTKVTKEQRSRRL
jgi:hypothetical protein